MNTKTNAGNKIKAMLPELSKQTGLIRQAQERNKSRVQELRAERDALLKAPITREDYAELICVDIDLKADQYRDRAAQEVRSNATGDSRPSTPAKVGTAMTVLDGSRGSDALIGNIRRAGFHDGDDVELAQGAATFFMREQMKKAATEIVNAINPWPYPDAQPMRQTIARINAIDAELATLAAEAAELDDIVSSIAVW